MRATMLALGLALGCKKAPVERPSPESVAAEPAEPAEPASILDPPPGETGPAIVLPCSWPAGSRFDYTHDRHRTDGRQPDLAALTTHTPLTVTVHGEDPVLVDYALGTTAFEGPEALTTAAREALARTGFDQPSILRLGVADGAVTSLANLDEVVAAMEPVMRASVEGAPPEVAEQAMSMMRDPDLLQAILLKEPGLFFDLHCTALAEGQSLQRDIAFPNPFGGPPIAGRTRTTLVAHDPEARTATYETRTLMDDDAFEEVATAALQRVAPPGSLDDEMLRTLLAKMPPLRASAEGTLTYSTADGFPVRIALTQAVGDPEHPMRRTDTWIWTRTTP